MRRWQGRMCPQRHPFASVEGSRGAQPLLARMRLLHPLLARHDRDVLLGRRDQLLPRREVPRLQRRAVQRVQSGAHRLLLHGCLPGQLCGPRAGHLRVVDEPPAADACADPGALQLRQRLGVLQLLRRRGPRLLVGRGRQVLPRAGLRRLQRRAVFPLPRRRLKDRQVLQEDLLPQSSRAAGVPVVVPPHLPLSRARACVEARRCTG
mmetsp:Transcript_36908/g.104969  ORF Transcript_36908/g.104969 Transcript_36908/m.104969 type:complete len:207 (-) Transcript_36908:221-841(-)